MVARPIHRFGSTDVLFHGAGAAALSGLRRGTAALFGVAGQAARSVRDASWTLPPATGLADLGDIAGEGLVTAAANAILDLGAAPMLCVDHAGYGAAVAMLETVLHRDRAGTAFVLIGPRLDPFLAAGTHLAIGTHDLLPARDLTRWTVAGGAIVTADQVEDGGAASVAPAIRLLGQRRCVVLLDIGVIDTGHAAGAAALNVGGLTPAGFAMVLRGLRDVPDLAALAICGLAPERDPRGHSERLAAQAVVTLAEASTRR